MKKIILTLVLSLSFLSSFSQKRYIKKLEIARNYYSFYQESRFNHIFKKVGKYKKNRIYIEKTDCGTTLLIQSKGIKQLSNYYLVRDVSEARFNNIEQINNFIAKLQYGKSKNKIHKRISNL